MVVQQKQSQLSQATHCPATSITRSACLSARLSVVCLSLFTKKSTAVQTERTVSQFDGKDSKKVMVVKGQNSGKQLNGNLAFSYLVVVAGGISTEPEKNNSEHTKVALTVCLSLQIIIMLCYTAED